MCTQTQDRLKAVVGPRQIVINRDIFLDFVVKIDLKRIKTIRKP